MDAADIGGVSKLRIPRSFGHRHLGACLADGSVRSTNFRMLSERETDRRRQFHALQRYDAARRGDGAARDAPPRGDHFRFLNGCGL